MKLKLHYINSKRAFCFCPWHESRKGTADLEITLTGTYQGKYYCHGCGKSGYITMNILNKLLKIRKKSGAKEPTPMDFEELCGQYSLSFSDNTLPVPFNGISLMVHAQIEVGWDDEAFTIPFRNAKQEIVGIQRRFPDGFKCMVEGSQLGLIIPDEALLHNQPLYITEGASDLAVVLECGLQGIGRPNCNAIPEMLVEFCEPFNEIIIVPDNDEPGINGAEALLDKLDQTQMAYLITPEPYNDLYEMYKKDGKEKTKTFLTT